MHSRQARLRSKLEASRKLATVTWKKRSWTARERSCAVASITCAGNRWNSSPSQRWHNVMMDWEARVLELKQEVNELLAREGQQLRYPISAGERDA